jgi:hypothetical protein
MTTTMRQLRKLKPKARRDTAKLHMKREGLSGSPMSRSADCSVIRLLNLPPNSITKRLSEIVDDCDRASQLSEAIKFSSASDVRPQLSELEKVMEALNLRLSKYKWHPRVLADMSLGSYFHVQYEFSAVDNRAAFENEAVQWLMQHIEVVHRVRRCRRPECRQWFFAKTEHQKYCGNDCRKREGSQGTSFKEKRRIYMKRYREEQRERDARALQAAVRKSK